MPGAAIPFRQQFLQHRSALERQGALVFQLKQCHNCHSLGNEGGKRGPALDHVALVQTEDQLIRQVIQGGGNMPAYGKNLSPAETTALVAFPENSSSCRAAARARCVPRRRHGYRLQLQRSPSHNQPCPPKPNLSSMHGRHRSPST